MKLSRIPQDIRDIKRLEHIVNVLFKHEFGFLVEHLKMKHLLPLPKRLQKDKFEYKDTQPKRLRRIFEELGGTFIKLGQLLSLRPDLIPKEYCEEFSKLQDEVEPFPTKDAKKIIEAELKKDIKHLFGFFGEKPVAAASIGQVHQAILRNGKRIAIKVQRPDIKKTMETDIDILKHLAVLIEKKLHLEIIKPTEIIDEFERYTRKELDYLKEAKNIDIFYKNFSDDNTTVIPKVYWDYTTDKVLTMDFIAGHKLSELNKVKKSVNKKEIAKKIVDSIFKQVFVDGVFHADPHPGNIVIMEKGKIGFLDFGIVGFFDEELKEKIGNLFTSMVKGDLETTTESFADIGVIEAGIDQENLKEDLYDAMNVYYGTPLKDIELSKLFHEIISIAKSHNMTLPADLILLGKTVVTTESVAVGLDPKFNLVEFAKPFVEKLVKKRTRPKYIAHKLMKTTHEIKRFISKVPEQTTELINRIREGDKSIQEIDKDIKTLAHEMDKSSNRVALGLLVTAFLVSSALISTMNQPRLIGLPLFSLIGFTIAFIFMLLLLVSILRERG